MSSTLAACSGVFCGGGALLNLALQRHSARNPDSWINRKVCINNNINDQQPVRSFLVTLLGQLLIYPFFFVTAWRSGVARGGLSGPADGPRLRMLIDDRHSPRTVASVQPPKSSIRPLAASSAVVKLWFAAGSAPVVANGAHVT